MIKFKPFKMYIFSFVSVLFLQAMQRIPRAQDEFLKSITKTEYFYSTAADSSKQTLKHDYGEQTVSGECAVLFSTLPKVLVAKKSEEMNIKTKVNDLQPAFVYSNLEPDQEFDLLESLSNPKGKSREPSDPPIVPIAKKQSVLLKAGETLPFDSHFCPVNAKGSSFFLVITEKDVLEKDSSVTGIVFIESAVIPSTFVKADKSNVLVVAIISVEISIEKDIENDSIILDDKSYHEILSTQRDTGPISSAVETTMEMEEDEKEDRPEEVPSLNQPPRRKSKTPGKYQNFQKWD